MAITPEGFWTWYGVTAIREAIVLDYTESEFTVMNVFEELIDEATAWERVHDDKRAEGEDSEDAKACYASQWGVVTLPGMGYGRETWTQRMGSSQIQYHGPVEQPIQPELHADPKACAFDVGTFIHLYKYHECDLAWLKAFF